MRSGNSEGISGVVNELLIQMQSFDDPPGAALVMNKVKDFVNGFLPYKRQLRKRGLRWYYKWQLRRPILGLGGAQVLVKPGREAPDPRDQVERLHHAGFQHKVVLLSKQPLNLPKQPTCLFLLCHRVPPVWMCRASPLRWG